MIKRRPRKKIAFRLLFSFFGFWGFLGFLSHAAAARLERREAVLHGRGLWVEELVLCPLRAPALLSRVEEGARVRLLDLLGLGVEVLVRPALRHDLASDWCAELALGVLTPHRLGRRLVTVEPLARPLDLAARIVLLDADARLDGHELGMRLHLIGHA